MNDEYPKKRSSSNSTERGFTVEARFNFDTPQQLAGHLLDNRWQELHFTESPIGVPAKRFQSGISHGMFSYAGAQALRWWFHAVAELEYKDICLETRLIEHTIESTSKVTTIAEHKPIGGDDRSSLMPNWGREGYSAMTPNRLTFNYSTDESLREQVAAWLRLSGYHVERVQTPPVSVGELAAMVGRKVGSVSRSLRRFDCPLGDVVYGRGAKRRRIIKLVPHAKLIAWLRTRPVAKETELPLNDQSSATGL